MVESLMIQYRSFWDPTMIAPVQHPPGALQTARIVWPRQPMISSDTPMDLPACKTFNDAHYLCFPLDPMEYAIGDFIRFHVISCVISCLVPCNVPIKFPWNISNSHENIIDLYNITCYICVLAQAGWKFSVKPPEHLLVPMRSHAIPWPPMTTRETWVPMGSQDWCYGWV